MKKQQTIHANSENANQSALFRNVFLVSLITLVLLFMDTICYPQSQLKWAKRVGGASDDVSTSLAIDSTGNVYLTGTFQGTGDFDPGPDTVDLTSEGSTDVFILKLDPEGNFIWAKRIGSNNGNTLPFTLAVDTSGNMFLTGDFSGTIDFDPSQGMYNLSSDSGHLFILKLDSSGTFVWVKNIKAESTFVAVDLPGNVYLTGRFGGTVDFDPGPGVYNLTYEGDASWPYGDIFILKLDSAGDFVWARRIGGIADDWGTYIAVDTLGHLIVEGFFGARVDFDPGPGVYYLTGNGPYYYGFHLDLDSAGNFTSVYSQGAAQATYFMRISLAFQDNSGNVYTTGRLYGTVDFDPGPGVYNLTSAGESDIFVTKTKQFTSLPVALIAFSAEQFGTFNQLNWQTAQEQNTLSFLIERSTDGSNFYKIGSVAAGGNSAVPKLYSFTDARPLVGTSFYRLKILDNNGSFTYSTIVAVKRSEIPAVLQLFPNPVIDILYVKMTGNGSATIQITDAAGRILMTQVKNLNGSRSITVNVHSLPKGKYYLLLQQNDKRLVQVFIKQ